VAVCIALLALVALVTVSTIHVTTVAARHRRGTARGLAVLAVAWVLCAAVSVQFIPGFPVASTSAAGLADEQIRAGHAAIDDPRLFGRAIYSHDPQAAIPAADLLTGLRGKDVIIAVVESYGQVA